MEDNLYIKHLEDMCDSQAYQIEQLQDALEAVLSVPSSIESDTVLSSALKILKESRYEPQA